MGLGTSLHMQLSALGLCPGIAVQGTPPGSTSQFKVAIPCFGDLLEQRQHSGRLGVETVVNPEEIIWNQ